MWDITVHDTKFEQISHLETCVGCISFYVSYHNSLFFGIPQIIVFICALQFITFCVHAPSKKCDRCWSLLWTNRSEKTVILSSLQNQIFNKFICKWFINPFSNRSYQQVSCGWCTVTHCLWCRRKKSYINACGINKAFSCLRLFVALGCKV